MLPISLEALEDLAERARAAHVALVRAALAGEPEPLMRMPDAARLGRAHALAHTTDPALGILLAEAVTLDALRRPARAYELAWAANPVVLPGENPISWRSLGHAIALEANPPRRAALAKAGDALARDRTTAARTLVDAWRDCATSLGLDRPSALSGALGIGDAVDVIAASEAVLRATSEIYRELEAWVRPHAGLVKQGELSWEERLRLTHAPRATELIPQGDRMGAASRWIERIGLDRSMSTVRDETQSASVRATTVRAFGARRVVVIAGTPSTTASGAVSLAGACCEALSFALASEPREAQRLGVDRVHHAVAECFGRRLYLDPAFVTRSVGIDRGQREPALLECLWSELFTLRVDAALARFSVDVLDRTADLAARLREYLAQATGSAPAPGWAVHFAARSLELRAGARTIAALVEPVLHAEMREMHDEDWFRNPRAGETLTDRVNSLRTRGTIAWASPAGERSRALRGEPLERRLAELLTAARR